MGYGFCGIVLFMGVSWWVCVLVCLLWWEYKLKVFILGLVGMGFVCGCGVCVYREYWNGCYERGG